MTRIKLMFSTVLLVFSLMALEQTAYGQDLPTKYPTLELFTNTPCPICGSQNPGLFSRLANYEGEYHLVSFYPGKPYSSCIYYQANVAENTARYQHYTGSIFGSPTVALNGIDFKNSNGVTNMVLENLTGGESWLEVHVEETDGSTRSVTIDLEDHVGGSLTTGKLVAVVVEKLIMYNAPNGETKHYNVFRQFLGPINGEDVDMSGGTASRTYEYTLDAEWEADQVYVVAWLSDPASKEIYNSGTKFDPDFTTSIKPLVIQSLSIYPSPATSDVYVRMPEDVSSADIHMLDYQGRVLQSIVANTDAEVKLLTNQFAAGKYFVQLKSGNNTYVGSFDLVK